MTEEEAESAEIIPLELLGSFDLQGTPENEGFFLLPQGRLAFGRFSLSVLCDLCG
jgi:hypothetical protein